MTEKSFLGGLQSIGRDLMDSERRGKRLQRLGDETLIGQILTGAYEAARAPGDAATGKLDPYVMGSDGQPHVNPEVYDLTADMADLATLGAAPMVKAGLKHGVSRMGPTFAPPGPSTKRMAQALRESPVDIDSRIAQAYDDAMPRDATMDDFGREGLPGILSRDNWAIMTAENPGGVAQDVVKNLDANTALVKELEKRGIDYQPVTGRYGNPVDENSYLMLTDEGTARELGKQFGQDSVLTRRGLIYGDDTVNPATGVTVHETAPDDFFSTVGDTPFTVDIDFDTRMKLPGQPQLSEDAARQLESVVDPEAIGQILADRDPLAMPALSTGMSMGQRFQTRPQAGPPELRQKGAKKIVLDDAPQTDWQNTELPKDQYYGKRRTSEEEELMAAIDETNKQMAQGGYSPYFDPSQRFDADVSRYPTDQRTVDTLVAKRPDTRAKYEAEAGSSEVVQGLREAYAAAAGDPGAVDWYQVGQLEQAFIDELGPVEGPAMFKQKFADAMAATTGGMDPGQNFKLAMYGNERQAAGLPAAPEAGHQIPAGAGGGRYSPLGNLKQQDKALAQGGIDMATNPKRHNFARNFMGDDQAVTLDEQMSELMGRGMERGTGRSKAASFGGRDYGPYEKVIQEEAARLGISPRQLQEVAWAGHKGSHGKPMIDFINEAVERTSRITGVDPEEVVRKGIVRSEMPIYSNHPGMAAVNAINEMSPDQLEAMMIANELTKGRVAEQAPEGVDQRQYEEFLAKRLRGSAV